jgi:mono/diheme cytochrome c family protein
VAALARAPPAWNGKVRHQMLGPLLFLLLWIITALVLFLVALSGGPRGARAKLQSSSRRAWRLAFGAFIVVFVGIGVAVPALVIAGAHHNQETEARTFASTCGTCHTLARAGATGTVGPNLDQLMPTVLRVENALRIGGTGDGRMPVGLLQGAEAVQMAQFVASVAGRRG